MAELDRDGRWQEIPGYGHVWRPNAIEVDWAPYRVGHWAWVAPWGWTWVSSEAWGWAPYHYGRWVTYSSHWYWVPEAPAAHARWSPALVAFVGAGPGWSANVSIRGGGYVGWFPLGPREPFVPWWGGARANVSVTNVTYVNRNYVTVVNHDTFVSSAPVVRNVVRDAAIVKQVSASPVVRGPIPAAATKASLRISGATPGATAARPPAAVLARSIVTKSEPPPPKTRFDAEEKVAKPPAAAVPAGKQPVSVAPAPAGAGTTNAEVTHRTIRPAQPQQAGKATEIALAPHDNKAPRRQVEPLSAKPHPKSNKDKKKEPAPQNEIGRASC